MSSEISGRIPTQVQQLLASPKFRNRVAQAHSRAVLRRTKTDGQNWPQYDPGLDEDLHYTAHYLLWHGFQLKSADGQDTIGDLLIKQGAEILEYLYAYSDNPMNDGVRQLFNAALAYYIAGYYARSYVLMKDLASDTDLPQELQLLQRLFLKDMSGARNLVSAILFSGNYSDAVIATNMRTGEITEDEALSRILHATLNRAFSFFIEYPKTGQQALLNRAIELADYGIDLAHQTHFADWWWLLTCARYLFREFGDNALWKQLSPLNSDDPTGGIVEPYIRANYRRKHSVTELWRSQTAALPHIYEPERRSYCLRMPTSAGKTRIAELAILRFLLDNFDDPTAKCIYIAPFRSLAVEIEQSLQEVFHPIGLHVSEIYGGFELSPIEKMFLERTRIVVATPEKIDAFMRFNPEFADWVKLIIIDEGHIISLSERGLRYEMFLQRLVRRFVMKGVRTFFLSAVLPNTDEFAQWIAGQQENVLQTAWRPSRQLIGELRWDGHSARIDFLESDHSALEHECFVPHFIVPIDPRPLRPRGILRRREFPKEIGEVVAEAAVRLAQQSMTMVFCARKQSAMPLARNVMESIQIQAAVAAEMGMSFALPISEDGRKQLNDCIRLAEETMGGDNEVIDFLRVGVVVHHSGIPKSLRIRLEQLARQGIVNLVIASPTLAQGVNLPIQTVIVHGLSHGHDQELTPPSFWNICGRAGRGLMENEGQVLFAVDLTKDRRRIQREKHLRNEIIQGYDTYRIKSALQELLRIIAQEWQLTHPSVNIADLCQRLADNDLSWISNDRRSSIERYLAWIDTELLAITQESGATEITPDLLQELMSNSLALLQAGKADLADQWIAYIRDALFARLQYVFSQAQTDLQRKGYYLLGLPVRDCKKIEVNQDEILALFMQSESYLEWDVQSRCEYLVKIAAFLLTLDELKPNNTWPDECWQQILRLWLQGNNPNEISSDPLVATYTQSPAEISVYIDDVFSYKLPWGLNAVNVYLARLAPERGLALPAVLSFFSPLVKYGVHDPIASSLLAFGLASRKLALFLSLTHPVPVVDVFDTLVWFLGLRVETFEGLNLSEEQIREVRAAQIMAGRLQNIGFQHQARKQTRLRIICPHLDADSAVQVGDLLILKPAAEDPIQTFDLYTLWGVRLNSFHYDRQLPETWLHPEKIEVIVEKVELFEDAQTALEFVVRDV
jgi:hypothetical protein